MELIELVDFESAKKTTIATATTTTAHTHSTICFFHIREFNQFDCLLLREQNTLDHTMC